MEREVLVYRAVDGKRPYFDWFFAIKDKNICHRIETRIDRIRHGNYGDHKRFYGIIELRINFGKGYRIYCAEDQEKIVILLVGGDKSSQGQDIRTALEYWRDYREQKKI